MFQEINVYNIKISLFYIFDFINNKKLKNNREKDISFLKNFSQIVFNFIFTIFKNIQ